MARRGKGLPDTLHIAGRPYSVIFNSPKVKYQNLLGFCNNDQYEIHLDDDQHPHSLKDTALHESLHAISNSVKLGLNERQVAVLAGQLLDFFGRNPEFTRWLLG